MGNQGLLTFDPTKGWEQKAVDEVEPLLPFVPFNQLDGLPYMTANELVIWVIMGFVIAVRLNSNIISQSTMEKSGQHAGNKNKKWKNTLKFFLAPCLLLVLWQIAIMTPLNLFEGIPYLIIVLINALYGGDLIDWLPGSVAILLTILLIIAFFLYLEKRRRKTLTESFSHFSFTLFSVQNSLLLFLAGWLPFAFWALSWIPLYWLAFILSFGLAVIVYLKALQTLEKFKTGDSPPE